MHRLHELRHCPDYAKYPAVELTAVELGHRELAGFAQHFDKPVAMGATGMNRSEYLRRCDVTERPEETRQVVVGRTGWQVADA